MYLRQVKVGFYENFNYLIGPEEGTAAAVVDPAFELDRLFSIAGSDGKEVRYILLTHTHPDHVEGLKEMAERTGAPVYVHPKEMDRARQAVAGLNGVVFHPLEDGDWVDIAGLKGRVIHTPGHTPGGVCYLFGNTIITGDTLFVNGCGRCDLSGGDPRDLYESLYKKVLPLPDHVAVYTGHDYGDLPSSSIGREKERNPYLKWKTVEEFVQYRMVGYLKDKKLSL